MLKKIIVLTSMSYTLLFSETLIKLTDEIVHTNPELQEKIHYYNSLREEYKYSKSENLPRIDFAVEFGQEYTKSPSTNNKDVDLTKATSSLQLVQNIFNGFQTSNNIDEQKAKFISASFSVLEKTNSLALNVAEIYLNILKYNQLIALSKKDIAMYERILLQIKEKVDSGFSPKSDMLQIQTRYTLAKANLVSQEDSLESELTKFHKLLGRFVDKQEFINPLSNFMVPQSIDQATRMALSEHPAIKIANYNVEAKQYAYSKEKNRYYPSVDFVAKAEKNSNTSAVEGETDRYYAGIQLKYNLFNGFADKAVIQKNISMIQEENDVRNKIRRQIIESVRLSWNTYNALIKKDALLKEHVDFANQARDAYNQEFMIGKRSLLDLLNIENEYNSAEQALTDNYYTMLYTKYQLLDSMGILSKRLGITIKDKIDSDEYADGKKSNYIEDILPLDLERDKDDVLDMKDLCDNSLQNSSVNMFGCVENGVVKTLLPQRVVPPKVEIFEAPKEERDAEIQPTTQMQPRIEAPVILSAPVVAISQNEEELMLEEEMQEEEKSKESKIQAISTQEVEKERVKRALEKQIIYFDYKSSTIAIDSQHTLNEVLAIMNEQEDVQLQLFGYTDDKASKKYNQKLSLKRAKIVKDYLTKKGIEEERIFTYGKGEASPIATNATNEGRKKNRRVEFLFTKGNIQEAPQMIEEEIVEAPQQIVQEVKNGPFWAVRISSYAKEANAQVSAERINKYIQSTPKLSALQKELHFEATVRKSGTYYMSVVKPIIDKDIAKEVLRLIQKKYPNSYLRKEIGEIKTQTKIAPKKQTRKVRISKPIEVEKPVAVTAPKVSQTPKQAQVTRVAPPRTTIQDDFDSVMSSTNAQDFENVAFDENDNSLENMELEKIDVDF